MQVDHPPIFISIFKYAKAKTLNVCNDSYYQRQKDDIAGVYETVEKIMCIVYGKFFKELMHKHNRTIEQQVCNTISHEFLHHVLNREQNWKVSAQFDNIAPTLAEYGVW